MKDKGIMRRLILFIIVLAFISCDGSNDNDLNINRTLEPGFREMTDEELIWWQDTNDCLKQEGIINNDCFPEEPDVLVIEGNNIPETVCNRDILGCAVMEGLEIVIISEVGIHYEQIIRHETHHTTLVSCTGSFDRGHEGAFWDGRCGAFPTLNELGLGDFFRNIEFESSNH